MLSDINVMALPAGVTNRWTRKRNKSRHGLCLNQGYQPLKVGANGNSGVALVRPMQTFWPNTQ